LILTLQSMNKIILVTSHILPTLFPICSEILWLNEGKIEKSFLKSDFESISNEIFK
jgi:ABC-type multidrug transport system ATPase subunit